MNSISINALVLNNIMSFKGNCLKLDNSMDIQGSLNVWSITLEHYQETLIPAFYAEGKMNIKDDILNFLGGKFENPRATWLLCTHTHLMIKLLSSAFKTKQMKSIEWIMEISKNVDIFKDHSTTGRLKTKNWFQRICMSKMSRCEFNPGLTTEMTGWRI